MGKIVVKISRWCGMPKCSVPEHQKRSLNIDRVISLLIFNGSNPFSNPVNPVVLSKNSMVNILLFEQIFYRNRIAVGINDMRAEFPAVLRQRNLQSNLVLTLLQVNRNTIAL